MEQCEKCGVMYEERPNIYNDPVPFICNDCEEIQETVIGSYD